MVKKQGNTYCHPTGREPHSHSALMLLLSKHKEFPSKPHCYTAPPPHTQSIHISSQHRKPQRKLFQYLDHQLTMEEKNFATPTTGIKDH